MLNIINKITIPQKAFVLVFSFLLLLTSYLSPVLAACPDNVVPNPLDPECRIQQGGTQLTIGFLINRFIVFLPYVVTILAVAAFAWGAVKIIWAQDEDGRNEGIKILINAAIGLGVFFSIWLILFIISLITGFDLLATLGV